MNQSIEKFSQPSDEHLKILKKLGLKTFKPEQWEAIITILNERRNIVITAGTSYGKSLIYQFISILLNKKCIVIGQTEIYLETLAWKLERKGFTASISSIKNYDCIEESQFIFTTSKQIKNIYENLLEKNLLDEICLIAIEEFGNSYEEIALVKQFFPSISSPLVVSNSTMDDELRIDIKNNLLLNNPLNIKVSLNRPNLEYFIHENVPDVIESCRSYLEEIKKGSGLIYTSHKTNVQNVIRKMQENGFQAKAYHADVPKHERLKTLNEFMNGKLKFIVAVTGMYDQIDKDDIRLVLHLSAPKSLEIYYRETGRAGRDGKAAKCVLFWTSNDTENWHQTESSAVSQMMKMRNFVLNENCRRQVLFQTIDYDYKSENLNTENCCDNCKRKIFQKVAPNLIFEELNSNGIYDATKEARIMIQIINSYKQTCREEFLYGMLLGKKPKIFNPHHPLHLFRSGFNKPRDWHVYLKKILITKQFIHESVNDKILKLTKIGKFFHRHSNQKVEFKPPFDVCFKYMTKTANEFYIENDEVKSRPRKVTAEISKFENHKRTFELGFLKNTLKRVAENLRNLENCEVNLDSFKKPKSEDIQEAGCSHWDSNKLKQLPKSDNENDDEHIENFLEINRTIKRKSITSINEFLNYVEKSADEILNVKNNLEGNENETMECI